MQDDGGLERIRNTNNSSDIYSASPFHHATPNLRQLAESVQLNNRNTKMVPQSPTLAKLLAAASGRDGGQQSGDPSAQPHDGKRAARTSRSTYARNSLHTEAATESAEVDWLMPAPPTPQALSKHRTRSNPHSDHATTISYNAGNSREVRRSATSATSNAISLLSSKTVGLAFSSKNPFKAREVEFGSRGRQGDGAGLRRSSSGLLPPGPTSNGRSSSGDGNVQPMVRRLIGSTSSLRAMGRTNDINTAGKEHREGAMTMATVQNELDPHSKNDDKEEEEEEEEISEPVNVKKDKRKSFSPKKIDHRNLPEARRTLVLATPAKLRTITRQQPRQPNYGQHHHRTKSNGDAHPHLDGREAKTASYTPGKNPNSAGLSGEAGSILVDETPRISVGEAGGAGAGTRNRARGRVLEFGDGSDISEDELDLLKSLQPTPRNGAFRGWGTRNRQEDDGGEILVVETPRR